MRAPRTEGLKTCAYGSCPAPALTPDELKRMLGQAPVAGMCKKHTLQSAMIAKRTTLPPVKAEYHDAAPYAEWVNKAAASGTLRYKGLVLNELRQTDLAEVLGVHRVTVSRLANGHLSKVRKPVVTTLNPYLAYVATTPAWGVSLGQVAGAAELRYAPLGTVVVDYYGRAWQLRGQADAGKWCPAHWPDTRPSRAPGTAHGAKLDAPNYPARVVHLPARVQDSMIL